MLMFISGTSVIQVTATDADDSMYGNSAKLIYSISQGHPYFSVDPNTGMFDILRVMMTHAYTKGENLVAGSYQIMRGVNTIQRLYKG